MPLRPDRHQGQIDVDVVSAAVAGAKAMDPLEKLAFPLPRPVAQALVISPGFGHGSQQLVDLATSAGVKIDTVLRPEGLSPPVLRYLAAKRQLSYYHGKRED